MLCPHFAQPALNRVGRADCEVPRPTATPLIEDVQDSSDAPPIPLSLYTRPEGDRLSHLLSLFSVQDPRPQIPPLGLFHSLEEILGALERMVSCCPFQVVTAGAGLAFRLTGGVASCLAWDRLAAHRTAVPSRTPAPQG